MFHKLENDREMIQSESLRVFILAEFSYWLCCQVGNLTEVSAATARAAGSEKQIFVTKSYIFCLLAAIIKTSTSHISIIQSYFA